MACRRITSNLTNSFGLYFTSFANKVSSGGYISSYFELNIKMHIETARSECFPVAPFKPHAELRIVLATGRSKNRSRYTNAASVVFNRNLYLKLHFVINSIQCRLIGAKMENSTTSSRTTCHLVSCFFSSYNRRVNISSP